MSASEGFSGWTLRLGCSTAFENDSLERACGRIAAMGFEWVDLICIPGWNQVVPSALVNDFEGVSSKVARLLDRYGLRAHAFNMAVPDLHRRGDKGVNRERIEQTRALVALMKRLGVERAGFYPGYYAEGRHPDEVLADTVASLREMLEIAGEAGVVIGPEIHRFTPFETPGQAKRLMEAVPELGVVYDASHFVMQGIPLEETAFMFPRVIHVHFRGSAEGKMQCMPSESTADHGWVCRQLALCGYAGNASIEYLPELEGDVECAIRETRDVVVSQFVNL